MNTLEHLKKPKSYVSIDLPGCVINEVCGTLAAPLAGIFNLMRTQLVWPDIWREEEAIAIPKTLRPTTYEECRAISCTSIFFKLAETYMIGLIREEINLKPLTLISRDSGPSQQQFSKLLLENNNKDYPRAWGVLYCCLLYTSDAADE